MHDVVFEERLFVEGSQVRVNVDHGGPRVKLGLQREPQPPKPDQVKAVAVDPVVDLLVRHSKLLIRLALLLLLETGHNLSLTSFLCINMHLSYKFSQSLKLSTYKHVRLFVLSLCLIFG